MDPITASIGIVGLGLSAAGAIGSWNDSKKLSNLSQQDFELQKRAEAQKRQQMELIAKRQQMEVLRNSQRARSLALANASGQGAQFGSGLQGGYGQIAGDSGNNLLGISQNLEIGRNLFDINAQRSEIGFQSSKVKSDQAMWQGLGSLGGQMMSWMKPIKEMTGSNAYSKAGPSSYFEPGGYGWQG